MSVTVSPEPLRARTLGKERRKAAAAEMRRLYGWTKRDMNRFYDRLVWHDKLHTGRSVVDAIQQAGR